LLFSLSHRCAERHQSKLCQLKALLAKGDTDDRNAQHRAEHSGFHSHGNPTKNQPKNITDDGNRASSKFNLLAKWKKCKLRKLEALLPNGDTNDRDAPEHTSSHPAETGPQPAEQKPKNISQTAHSSRLPFSICPRQNATGFGFILWKKLRRVNGKTGLGRKFTRREQTGNKLFKSMADAYGWIGKPKLPADWFRRAAEALSRAVLQSIDRQNFSAFLINFAFSLDKAACLRYDTIIFIVII
jgi:hypothetical protein